MHIGSGTARGDNKMWPTRARVLAVPVLAALLGVGVLSPATPADAVPSTAAVSEDPSGSPELLETATAPDDAATGGASPGSPTPSAPSATASLLVPGRAFAAAEIVLRVAPQRDAVTVLTVVAGTQVTLAQVGGECSEVSVTGETGWVPTSLLAADKPDTAIARTVYARSPLVLRPATTLERSVTTVPAGSRMSVVGISRGWERLSYNGKTGFVVRGGD